MLIGPTFVAPDASESEVQAQLEPWRKLAAFGNGSYVNFISEATEAEIASAYPGKTYDRLASVKRTYDPDNVFSQNFNITPQ